MPLVVNCDKPFPDLYLWLAPRVDFFWSFSTVRRNRELLREKENFCEVQKFKKITRQACVEGTAWNYCDWILTDRPGLFGLLPGRAARHLRIDNADKKVGTNNPIHEQPLAK